MGYNTSESQDKKLSLAESSQVIDKIVVLSLHFVNFEAWFDLKNQIGNLLALTNCY